MCGIVGYFGKLTNIKLIIKKLKKLEYRGYDSAGIYAQNDKKDIILKSVGNISKLEEIMPNNFLSNIAIAHTRWATHGKPTNQNCHPHASFGGKWQVVHNGIIENYQLLRERLLHKPDSDTDTAVISQMLEEYKVTNIDKFIDLFKSVVGSYAIVAVHDNKLYLAKNRSPLYVAKTGRGFIAASDPVCFSEETNSFYSFNDNEFAIIDGNEIVFYDSAKKIVQKSLKNIEKIAKNDKKLKYKHFMLKEINEQEQVIKELINRYSNEKILERFNESDIKNIKKIIFLGCGTASHAGLMGAKYFEEIAGIEACAEISSEFIYKKKNFIDKNTLIIAVSQSGETADTLKAIEIAKNYGARVLSLTNVEYSTIVFLSDMIIPVCAGPEKAVASTKAYVCQLCALYILAGRFSNLIKNENIDYLNELKTIEKNILKFDKNQIDDIANQIKEHNNCIYIGKDLDFITASEASLKLKEVSYINSTSYPSGELKHGFLALVEDNTPIFVFATRKDINQKSYNAASEAESRGANKVIITNEEINQEKNAKIIKINCKNEYLAPILSIVPMQYLAYKVSVLKNINPDQPRNLAKSVTVE